MSKKICYEATIKVEFEPDPSWEVETDDDMWEAAGFMSISICQLAQVNDPTVKFIDISDYSECYIDEQ